MKRMLGILALAALLLIPQVSEAKKTRKSGDAEGWPAFLVPPQTQHSALVNPFFWWGNAGIAYERSVNADFSWNAGLDGGFWGIPSSYYRIVGLSGGVSWWVNQDFWPHPQVKRLGWYVGPQLHVRNMTWHYEIGPTGYDATGNYFGLGGQGGYQWIFAPGLTARLLGEAGFMAGSMDTRAGAPSVGYGGPYLTTGAAVGWSF